MPWAPGYCAEAVLFGLFYLGGIRALREHGSRRLGKSAASDDTRAARYVLLIIFLLPFAAYFLIGLVKLRFGHARNFFYLFPIYLLFAMHGLDWLAIPRSIKHLTVASIAAALTGGFTLPGYSDLRRGDLEHAALGIAAKVPAPLVVVQSSERAWAFKHYVGRLGALGKVYPWDIETDRAPQEYSTYFHARLPELVAAEKSVCVVAPEANRVEAPKTVSVFGRTFMAEPLLSSEPLIRVYCDRRR